MLPQDQRHRRVPPAAQAQPGADHHGDGQGRRDRHRRRARGRRRRLRHQAVPAARARGPDARRAAAVAGRRRRRARPVGASRSATSSLDPDEHTVAVAGEPLALPLKEFELLHVLLANAGRVLPRETLIDRVWGSDYVGDTKTLDVHVKRLRVEDRARPRRTRPASSRSAASATSTSAADGIAPDRRCTGRRCRSIARASARP